jgi:hypothetical protein
LAAPEEELQDWVWYYWHLDKNDKEIVELVLDNYDRTEYGLRYVTRVVMKAV